MQHTTQYLKIMVLIIAIFVSLPSEGAEKYEVTHDGINGGVITRASAGFTLKDAVGRSSPIGISSNTQYQLSVRFWIPTDDSTLPEGIQLLGERYNVMPLDEQGNPLTAFHEPVALLFQYDPELVALMGLVEQDLKLYHYNGTTWAPLLSIVDTAQHTVTGYTTQFSPFALGGKTVPEPSTLILFGLAFLGLAGLCHTLKRWKRRF